MNLSLRDRALSRLRESRFMHKAIREISTEVGEGGILQGSHMGRINAGQRGESGKAEKVERDGAQKNFFAIPR